MTTTVNVINGNGVTTSSIALTNDHASAKAVRLKFNPSGSSKVEELKVLAAALHAKVEEVQREAGALPLDIQQEVGRACSLAKTNLQQASMWAVFAATAHL